MRSSESGEFIATCGRWRGCLMWAVLIGGNCSWSACTLLLWAQSCPAATFPVQPESLCCTPTRVATCGSRFTNPSVYCSL